MRGAPLVRNDMRYRSYSNFQLKTGTAAYFCGSPGILISDSQQPLQSGHILPGNNDPLSVFQSRFKPAGKGRADAFDLIRVEHHGLAAPEEHGAAAKLLKFIQAKPA